jgi:hypothetical protein
MAWYAKKSAGTGQGIVIDEEDGRNVAVAYDEQDTALLAAAPDLLNACRKLLNVLEAEAECDFYKAHKQLAVDAIEKATGS